MTLQETGEFSSAPAFNLWHYAILVEVCEGNLASHVYMKLQQEGVF